MEVYSGAASRKKLDLRGKRSQSSCAKVFKDLDEGFKENQKG